MFLFGGLLDRCQNNEGINDGYDWIRRAILRIGVRQENTTEYFTVPEIQSDIKKTITSQPYQLCLCECEDYFLYYNCSKEKTASI